MEWETAAPAKLFLVAFRPRPYHRLSLPLIREICLYFTSRLLIPSIRNRLLRLYSPETRTYLSCALSIVFPPGSSFCVFREKSVLCLPVNYPQPKAYELSMATAKLTKLAPVSTARKAPGLIEFGDFIYVFGGISRVSPLHSEKFHTAKKAWGRIAYEVQRQYQFTPAAYRNEVYLSCVHAQIEVFSPQRETFRTVFLACPYAYDESVGFFVEDCLHILTKEGSLMRWRLKKSYAEAEQVLCAGEVVEMSAGPPVRMQGGVFWIGQDTGSLIRLDLRRRQVEAPHFTPED